MNRHLSLRLVIGFGLVVLSVSACGAFPPAPTPTPIPPTATTASVRKVLPRRAQRGSGLGLAIVRSIAERHAGKVWLESQFGQGSTFFLLIPYDQPEGTKKEQNRL
jgi:C4-dicarboxylate-specific signal transduction histidine kinase